MKTTIMTILMVLVGAIGWGADSPGKSPVRTVEAVDLTRYMGRWFEIASFPQRFQKGCHCTTADYSMTDKGWVRVVNSCRKNGPEGRLKKAKAKAWVVPGSGNARLKVQFFWPFRGNYWIIDLDKDYAWAVVGDPTRKYLWILSRTPVMDAGLYAEIVARTAAQGFEVSKLKMCDQSCFESPR